MQLVLRQYDYWITVYRRTWRGSVITSFVLPFLFLAAMGIGLGGFVDEQADSRALDGLDYVSFIAPGLLATTAMQAAIGEATWPVYGNLKWNRVYQSMLATPLGVVDVLNAHLAFIGFRIATTAAVFIAVMAAFGTVASVPGAVVALLVAVLIGLAHTTPCFAFSVTRKDPSAFAVVFRVVVVPLSLFSGAFFPVSQLPSALEWFAKVTPMWHGVELVRMCTTGLVDRDAAVLHVGYLVLWAVAGWFVARHFFARQVGDTR
uniref:Transport permease protein n=1 Tax=uncultured Nocardioidaceae bacterium TaxID=253824 RepID=A0A6J4LDB4_9ACTN|nr:MAG: Efflux ABC transporter, permease protein [uncultured Nocardioidaceae bacterium]